MYKKETRIRLCELISQIGMEELIIESFRQTLCEQVDFEPYAAFKRLDRRKEGTLFIQEICEFLHSNGIEIDLKLVMQMIRHYDLDNDEGICYTEFLRIVLPQQNHKLRTEVTKRLTYDVPQDEFLPYDIEYTLSKLFEKEILISKKLEYQKILLTNSNDFNYKDAFLKIDNECQGRATFESISELFSSLGIKQEDEVLAASIRRIDKSGKLAINFEDFIAAIEPMDLIIRQNSQKLLQQENSQQQLGQTIGMQQQQNQSFQQGKITKQPTQDRQIKKNNLLKEYIQMDRRSNISGENNKPKTNQAGINKKVVKHYQEKGEKHQLTKQYQQFKDIMRNLKQIIAFENDLEIAKQDLAVCKDFNILDSFRLFDKLGKGLITSQEFEELLNEIQVYPEKDEVYLFFRRYDIDNDGRIRFSDYIDSIIPKQKEYAVVLNSRPTLNGNGLMEFRQLYQKETKKYFMKLFETHFTSEINIESIKIEIQGRRADIEEFFQSIDSDDDGFLDFSDFKKAMDVYGIIITEKELNILLYRLDKDRDGKVSFLEFIEEMTPKLI